MSSNSKPEILKIKPPAVLTTGQQIDSDVLRPVVFTSDNLFARFELEPKGHLSPTSSISFSVVPTADVERAFFPPNVGVHSLIKRAVLRTSSGRVISDMDEFSHFSSLRSMMKSNDLQTQREQYLSGRDMDFEPVYSDEGITAERYGLTNGREYTTEGILDADEGASQGKAQQCGLCHHNFQYITTQDGRSNLSPSYSITLHELFPFLASNNHLPLFMFESDRIQIELYFSDVLNDRVSLCKKDDGNTDKQFEIDQNSVELISDHIFYPQQSLEQMKKDEPTQYPYFDYILSRQTITANDGDATKDTAKTNVRNVGGAGMVVTRLFGAYVPTGNKELSILNKYQALAMKPTTKQSGQLETNVFYNERFLYPLNLKNNSRHFFNLTNSNKRHYHTTREVYSASGEALVLDATASHKYEGRGQTAGLKGTQFWQGFRLNLGERIGSKGIEVTMNARGVNGDGEGLDDGEYTQFVYLEVARQLLMNPTDGQIETMYG